MKIHEYQAKAILARHGVPVPRGEVAFNAVEAGEIARRLGTPVVVVKAQIHAGGRGKGGGVKIAKSPDEAEALARRMIGMTLITHQTGPGRPRRLAGARRRGAADDARAVPEPRARSGVGQAGDDGQRRRRHGHRGGGRVDAGEDRQGVHRAGGRPRAVRGATARVRDRPRRPAGDQGGHADDGAVRDLRRDRRVAGRNQPARHDRSPAICSRSTRR